MSETLKNYPDLNTTIQYAHKDGVDFYHIKKPGAPLTINIPFDFGSLHGTVPGASHFLEHILVSGTEKWPTREALMSYVQENGWIRNAFTWKHRMMFPLWCNNAADLSKAFEYFDQCLFHTIFKEETIQSERKAIFDEIKRSEADVDRFANDTRFSLLFPQNILSKPVLGSEENLKAINSDELKKNRDILLSRSRCIVTVGGMEMDEIVSSAQVLIDSLKERAVNATEDKIIPIEKIQTEVKMPFKGARFNCLYGINKEESDEEAAVLRFIQFILINQNGLLIRKLRFEKGLTYGVSPLRSITKYFNFIGAEITCEIDNLNEVEAITIKGFEETLFDEITEEKKKLYLDFRSTRRLRDWEKGDTWAETYHMDFLTNGKNTRFFDDYENTLKSLSIDEIKRIAKSFINSQNRSSIRYIGEK